MFQQETRALGRSSRISLLPIALVSFAVLFIAQIATTQRFGVPMLIGDKTEAMFDLWSLQHFCTGILIGSKLVRSRFCRSSTATEFVLVVFLLALCWEATELSMEAGLFGQPVSYWKAGFEHWSNRLLGDPAMVVTGALVAMRFSQA